MSHIVTVQTQLRDPAALTAACTRLGLPVPVQGTARLYSGTATGLLVHLPGWRYPVVVDTASGTLSYDNYGEVWGEKAQLDRLTQMYAVEKAKIEARRRGMQFTEQALQDGSIRLQIVEGPQ